MFFSVPLVLCWNNILTYYCVYSINGLFSPNLLKILAPVIPLYISHVHMQPTEDRVRLCSGMYFYSWAYSNKARPTPSFLLSPYVSATVVAMFVSEDGVEENTEFFFRNPQLFSLFVHVCVKTLC